jgi:hypothetical protein
MRRCHGGPVFNYINSLIRLAFRDDLRSIDNTRQPVFPLDDFSTNSGLTRGQYGMDGSKGNVLRRDLRHNALVAGSARRLAP